MSKEIKSVDYGLEKIFEGAQDFLPLLGAIPKHCSSVKHAQTLPSALNMFA